MQLQSFLQKSGLDKNEVDVYLALVQMGEASAGQISKKSLVPRTYTYRVLDDLIDKGLVESSEQRSIRRYKITDFEAPKRYLEKQQFELYSLQQEAQALHAQLENMANPQVPIAVAEPQKGELAREELWKLLHSTITREVWVINPPGWWGKAESSPEVQKWEQFRLKQHIWEKRYFSPDHEILEAKYTESARLKNTCPQATLILVDQYSLQITNWDPFRALRIVSQEMVELHKALLE